MCMKKRALVHSPVVRHLGAFHKLRHLFLGEGLKIDGKMMTNMPKKGVTWGKEGSKCQEKFVTSFIDCSLYEHASI